MKTTFTRLPTDFWQSPKTYTLNELNAETRLLAFYLLTSAHANMLGVYYLPLGYASLDTGLSLEQVSEGVASLTAIGFCQYDHATRYIWVCELAYYRTGGELKMTDNQIKGIHALYKKLPPLPFLSAFDKKYAAMFHLNEIDETPPLANPFEAPSEPLRSKKKNKQKEKYKNKEKEKLLYLSGKPDDAHTSFEKNNENTLKNQSADSTEIKQAKAIINFLNKKVGSNYRAVKSNIQLITTILRSGVTTEQCQQVIAKQYRKWHNDPDMVDCLRPATLFDPLKFEQYLGSLFVPKDETPTQEDDNDA